MINSVTNNTNIQSDSVSLLQQITHDPRFQAIVKKYNGQIDSKQAQDEINSFCQANYGGMIDARLVACNASTEIESFVRQDSIYAADMKTFYDDITKGDVKDALTYEHAAYSRADVICQQRFGESYSDLSSDAWSIMQFEE